jgi:hypothetical protein
MTNEIRNLPMIGQTEIVHRCKECMTEVIPVIDIRDNDIQLSCDKCRTTEFFPRSEIGDMRKHFQTEIYLAGVLIRTYK